MIRINLLPERAKKKKQSVRTQLLLAGVATFVVASLCGIYFFTLHGEAVALQDDIDNGKQEFAQLQKKIGELSKIKEQKRIVEDKLRVVEELEAARKGPVEMFSKLGVAIPEKAWVISLVDAGSVITLKGYAASEDDLSMFLRGLDEFKEIGAPELVVAQRGKRVGGRELVSFTIRLEK